MNKVISPAYDEKTVICDSEGFEEAYDFGTIVTIDDDKCVEVFDSYADRIIAYFNKDSWDSIRLVTTVNYSTHPAFDTYDEVEYEAITSGEYDSITNEDIEYIEDKV